MRVTLIQNDLLSSLIQRHKRRQKIKKTQVSSSSCILLIKEGPHSFSPTLFLTLMVKINSKQLNENYAEILPLSQNFLNKVYKMKDINISFKVPMMTLQISTIALFIVRHHISIWFALVSHNSNSLSQNDLIQSHQEKQAAISKLQNQTEQDTNETNLFQTAASIIAPIVLILQICLSASKAGKKQQQSNLSAFTLLLISLLDLYLFYQSPDCSFLSSEPSNLTENENENLTRSRVILVLMILGKLTAMLITSLGFNKIRRITHQPKIAPQSSSKINSHPAFQKKEFKKQSEAVSNKPANKLTFAPSSDVNQEALQTVLKQKLTANSLPHKKSKRDSLTKDSSSNECAKQQPQKQQQSSFNGSFVNEKKSFLSNFSITAPLPEIPLEIIDQSQQQPEFIKNVPQDCFQQPELNIYSASSLIQSDKCLQSAFLNYLLPSQPDNSANNCSDTVQISPSTHSYPEQIIKPTSPTIRPIIPIINQSALSYQQSSCITNLSPLQVQAQTSSSFFDKEQPTKPQILSSSLEQSSTKELSKIEQDIILETVEADLKKKWIVSLQQKRNQRAQSQKLALNNPATNLLDSSFNTPQGDSHVCTSSQQVLVDEQDSTNDESNFNSTNSNQEPLSNTNDHYIQCRTKREYLDETSKMKTTQFEMFFKQSCQQQEPFLEAQGQINQKHYENESSESDDDDIDDDEEDEEDYLRQQIQRKIHTIKLFQNSRAAQGHIPINEDICSDTASTHYQDLLSLADEIKSHLDLDLGDDNSLFSNSLRMKAIDDELSLLESEDAFKKNKKKKKSTEQKKKRRNKRKQMQKEKKQLLKVTGDCNNPSSKEKTKTAKGDQICNSAFTNESRSVHMKRLLDENLLEYYTLNVVISQNLSMNVYITDFSQFDYQFDMQSQFYGVDKDAILDSKINFIFEFLSLNLYPTFTPFFHELLLQYASIKLQRVIEQEEEQFKILKCSNQDNLQDSLENTLLSDNRESIISSCN